MLSYALKPDRVYFSQFTVSFTYDYSGTLTLKLDRTE